MKNSLVYLLILIFFSGCATTIQNVPIASGELSKEVSRITVLRKDGRAGIAFEIKDNNETIGNLATSGYLSWDRKPGKIILQGIHKSNNYQTEFYLKPNTHIVLDVSMFPYGEEPKIIAGTLLTKEYYLHEREKKEEQKKAKELREEEKNKVAAYESKGDYQKLKNYTDKYPHTAYFIKNNELRLAMTGPKGMKVGDIRELLKSGKSEHIVVSLIKRVKTPYLEYSIEEIELLQDLGLSDRIIAAMIDVTTKLMDNEQLRREHEFFLTEQKQIAEQNQAIQSYTSSNQTKTASIHDPVVDKVAGELAKQGIKLLLDSLFK